MTTTRTGWEPGGRQVGSARTRGRCSARCPGKRRNGPKARCRYRSAAARAACLFVVVVVAVGSLPVASPAVVVAAV